MTNYEIAQEINTRIGDVPVTDSLYEAALTIYQQLGGEVSEFDDVYSILQSIKEIARPGGDPITKVSVLPKSGEEYETKFLRTPDDKIYATGKVTMPAVYTNRLPDAQQIDKAYLYDDGTISYYKGAYKIVYNGGEVNGYGWLWREGDEWMIQVTSKDAVHTNRGDSVYILGWEDATALDEENNVAYTDMDGVEEYTVTAHVIPATYNAPEASQIGNAYFNNSGDSPFIYKGELEVECTNGNAIFYYWQAYDEWDSTYLTKIPASEIVSDTTGEYCATEFNFLTNMNIDSVTMQYNGTVDDCYSKFDNSSFYIGYVVEDGGGLSIPQLNAPDAEQVGKASITDEENGFVYKYEGDTLYTLTDDYQHTYYGYKWVCNDEEQGTIFVFTNEKASDIYSGNAIIYLAGAVDAWEYIGNNTYHETEGVSINYATLVDFDYSHSTVKYQRVDKPQSTLYGWQQVSVQGLILDEPVKKRYLLRGADLPSMRNEYGLTLREAWVNFNDETYTFNGKTYYKWIKYDDVYSEWEQGIKDAPSIPDSYMRDGNEIWILTTTLTPKLPFTLKSPECAYVITTSGESAEGGEYLIVDRECPKMAIEYTNGIISYFD